MHYFRVFIALQQPARRYQQGLSMKIAYCVSMFPRLSETFILSELLDHEAAGLEVSVFSLKPCNERIVHNKAVHLVARTTYRGARFWWQIWGLHLRLLIAQPATYAAVLYRLLAFGQVSPWNLDKLKCLIVFFCVPHFIRAAREQHIEHLHAHFVTYPAVLAWIIHRFTGIPFSATAHAHDIYVRYDLLKLVADAARAIVTISEYNKRFILEKLGWQTDEQSRKVEVIHCGIDLQAYTLRAPTRRSAPAGGRFQLLSVGRLVPMKGYGYLLEALALLRQERQDWTLDIVGDGPIRDDLVRQSATLGLNDHVRFLGAQKSAEVLARLREADGFVLACATCKKEIHDGLPVVFMEAMAIGVPVVGTRISGIPELIIHGQTGLCTEPADPVSLKDTLARLMNDPGHTAVMIRNARGLIEADYDIRQNSARLRNLFLTRSDSCSPTAGMSRERQARR
jgi:colanic acid/amylovoran biosynthesis glycosyltransferase